MFLYSVVNGIFDLYMIMLATAIISSWFPELEDYKVIKFIHFYTDPYLNFFRRWIPPLGMLDLSPIVAFFALQIIEIIVKGFLFS